MTAPTNPELSFGPTHVPVGFTSAAISQFDGSAEPVVRELIQNSLDAADKAGRTAEVRFEVIDVPVAEVPGWDVYVKAFEQAVAQRKKRVKSHDESMIVKRIEDMVAASSVPVLLCVDNGCGVNPQRMTSLLSVGNTDKGHGGAGSFGLGHHAAFGASDLRYVVYGSRYADKDGQLLPVSSGHAILATREESGCLLAADGFWRSGGSASHAWKDGTEFPREIPGMLSGHLAPGKTGTVVAIVGFNDFHREGNDLSAVGQIMQVAVANFQAAMHSGRLSVTAVDAEQMTKSNAATRDRVLDAVKEQRNAPRAGHISGAVAYAAHRSLQEGNGLNVSPGIEVRWRRLDPASQEKTQVHVFRRGMWISSRVDRLLKSNFASVRGFDAVVMLNSGELEQLIRSAEGPEHRGVDRKRLTKDERSRLRKLVTELAAKLSDAAGPREDDDTYVPESFAILSGKEVHKAESVPRPRRSSSGGGSKPNPSPRPTPDPNSRKKRKSPAPGRTADYRHMLFPSDGPGTVESEVDYREDVSDSHLVGIRIRIASGSDGTCDSPEPDGWAQMSDVWVNEEAVDVSGDKLEASASFGPGKNRLKVAFENPSITEEMLADGLLSIDIVKRRRPTVKFSKNPPPGHSPAAGET